MLVALCQFCPDPAAHIRTSMLDSRSVGLALRLQPRFPHPENIANESDAPQNKTKNESIFLVGGATKTLFNFALLGAHLIVDWHRSTNTTATKHVEHHPKLPC
eukprot:4121394-Amphidinium_carterae.1